MPVYSMPAPGHQTVTVPSQPDLVRSRALSTTSYIEGHRIILKRPKVIGQSRQRGREREVACASRRAAASGRRDLSRIDPASWFATSAVRAPPRSWIARGFRISDRSKRRCARFRWTRASQPVENRVARVWHPYNQPANGLATGRSACRRFARRLPGSLAGAGATPEI